MNNQPVTNQFPIYQDSGSSGHARWLTVVAALIMTVATVFVMPLSEVLTNVRREKDSTLSVREVDTKVFQLPPPAPLPPPPTAPAPEESQPPLPQPQFEPPPPQPRPPQPALSWNLKLPRQSLSLNRSLTFAVAPPPATSAIMGPATGSMRSLVFGLEQLDTVPQARIRIPPVYPYRARSRNIEGHADVQFTVTPAGEVENVVVLASEPPGMFENASRDAVSRWRFSPGMKDGRPVDTRMQIRIAFELDD